MVSLIKWDPFKDFEKFFSDDFFPALLPTVRVPSIPVDIYEKDGKLFVEVGLPGLNKEDIKVRIKDDSLIIEGTKEEKEEEKNKNYYRKEIRRSAFKRLIKLPYEIDEKEAKAEFKNGILIISFPKKESEDGKEIKIS